MRKLFPFHLIQVLLCCVLAQTGYAQVRYKTEYYSAEEGLSHRTVTSIVKDDDGFMWFGTWDGVNRFDGRSFKAFSSFGSGAPLENNRVVQMVDDHKGCLWILTYDNVLYRFDKSTETFISVKELVDRKTGKNIFFRSIAGIFNEGIWLISMNDGVFYLPVNNPSARDVVQFAATLEPARSLPSDKIFFIHEDDQHGIWIVCRGGVEKLVKTPSGSYKKEFQKTVFAPKSFIKRSENKSHIFFSTGEGAIGVYSKADRRFHTAELPGEHIATLLCSKLSDKVYITTKSGKLFVKEFKNNSLLGQGITARHELRGMFEDSNGNLWIEAVDAGIALLESGKDQFRYFSAAQAPRRYPSNQFEAFEDKNGTVWIRFLNGEFAYYQPEAGALHPALDFEGLSGRQYYNSVARVFYDKTGVIWVSSESGGIVKIILQRNVLLFEDIAQSDHFPDNEVRAVCFDNLYRQWVSAKGGRLAVRLKGRPVPVTFNRRAISDYSFIAYALKEDSRGNIWIGTKDSGLYKAIPQNSDRTAYILKHYPKIRNHQSGVTIHSILEDPAHNIWIGSYDAGLFRVSEKGDSCSFHPLSLRSSKYDAETFIKVRRLTADRHGAIWVATTGGLLILEPEHRQGNRYRVQIYRHDRSQSGGLPDNDVLYIMEDSREQMWVATAGGGISCVRKTPGGKRSFKTLHKKDGLANDYVLSCLEDNQGNIWMATEAGIACYAPDDGRLTNYDSYDGLPTRGFSESACAKDPEGNLVFGTSQGLVTFDPRKLPRTAVPSRVLFSSLQINNREAALVAGAADRGRDIHYVDVLRLRHDENTIALQYTIADYRRKAHQYVYRLKGFNNNWIKDVSGRAVFPHLPPGKYLFEVKGDGEDYLEGTYRKLAILIAPPFWRTWWAYGIYALLALGLLLMIRRFAITLIKLRNEVVIEQQLSELKLNFFTNISHELRTPLTLIVNPLEQLARREKLSAEGEGYLQVITKNAHRMVHFINQLLEFRKVQAEKLQLVRAPADLVQLARETAEHFKGQQLEKNIPFDIISEEASCNVSMDAEKIATVLYNLLANAFKFTPPGKAIRLRLTCDDGAGRVAVAVEDQGPGVKEEQLAGMFQLFHSGASTGNRQMKGIGIGLALSKELVELHEGTIEAFTNSYGGLTVRFTLKKEPLAPGSLPPAAPEGTAAAAVPQPPLPLESSLRPEPSGQPLVLLVEDDEELRSFLAQQLSRHYAVTTAANGAEGYAAARSLLPDLVVSDVMMPEMNGIELLDRLKNTPGTSHIPVVLLTAKSSVESQLEAIRYGADFYLTKPFNSDLLFASINSLLQRRARLFASLQTQRRVPEPAPTSVAPSELLPAEAVITEADEAFLKRVIAIVEEKMADYTFNIDLVAESVNMGRTTFYKKFKSLTGSAPVEFVRDMRLAKARKYFEDGTLKVSEVAALCGFNSPKYFSTCFREKYGLSPAEYIKDPGRVQA
ncbi:two-component regulator propeller domain-containing protein [Paraflavisolibacter sp. H34]|uniref:hybrid sensor histidine kinase/response regulator transcription factor n=1 Tax=Huijunlia imazamoxiresistens TaxID=3127457 RepID=UPI0030183C2F